MRRSDFKTDVTMMTVSIDDGLAISRVGAGAPMLLMPGPHRLAGQGFKRPTRSSLVWPVLAVKSSR